MICLSVGSFYPFIRSFTTKIEHALSSQNLLINGKNVQIIPRGITILASRGKIGTLKPYNRCGSQMTRNGCEATEL